MSVRRTVWERRAFVPQGLSLVLAISLIATPLSGLATAGDAIATTALAVASDPLGASVYIDGQFVGATPVNIDRLPAGDHRVRVVKAGFLENGRIVRTTAGRTSTVEVKLTRDVNLPAAAQVISSTGGVGGGSKKWLWLGIAGGAAAATAVYFATRNHPPVAGTISASPTTALQGGTTVTFTSQGASDPDGDQLTYSWNFGDNTSGSGQTVTKVYSTSGTMTVTLTVSDGKKDATATTSVNVRSLTARWTGSVGGIFTVTLNLTQSGTNVTGSYSDSDGFNGPVTGTVGTAGPRVRLTWVFSAGFTGTFNLEPNADVNSLTGTYSECCPQFGPAPTTLTRQ